MHPSSIVHSLVRFRDGAALAHLGYPDMTVPISFALTYPERAATDVPQLDLAAGLTLEFSAPDLETFPLLALARRAGELGGTYPVRLQRRERGRRRRVPRGQAAVPRDRRGRRGGARRGRRRARREIWPSSSRPTPTLAGSPGAECPSHEHLRLDPRPRLPDPDPRGGALLRRPRRRDESAQVLPRLPARAREDEAQRDRVRHRRDPARRLREDPRHAPPRGGRSGHALRPRRRGGSRRCDAPWTTCASGSRRTTTRARARPSSAPRRGDRGAPAVAVGRAGRRSAGVGDVDDALAPDAYWRAKTWKRVAVIFAGPGREPRLLASSSSRARSSWSGGGKATRRRRRGRCPTRPAAAMGLQAGDRIVAIDGKPVDGRRDRDRDLGRPSGQPITRHRGARRQRRSRSARPAEEVERRLPARLRPARRGLGPVESTWQAVRVTGIVTKEIGASSAGS